MFPDVYRDGNIETGQVYSRYTHARAGRCRVSTFPGSEIEAGRMTRIFCSVANKTTTSIVHPDVVEILVVALYRRHWPTLCTRFERFMYHF